MFVVSDKIRRFGRSLDKSLWVEPFQKFNVQLFPRVDKKTVDAFVEYEGDAKEFRILGEEVFRYANSQGSFTKWRPLTLAWRKAPMKSALLSVQCVAQVVGMRRLTPLEDEQGDQVPSKGWGMSIGWTLRLRPKISIHGVFVVFKFVHVIISTSMEDKSTSWILNLRPMKILRLSFIENKRFSLIKVIRCVLYNSTNILFRTESRLSLWNWAHADGYSFYPNGGQSRINNIDVLFESVTNAQRWLLSVISVAVPHGATCNVIAHEFTPQSLHLLQNPAVMKAENLLIDIQNPLKPYESQNRRLGNVLAIRNCLSWCTLSHHHRSNTATVRSNYSMDWPHPHCRQWSVFCLSRTRLPQPFSWGILTQDTSLGIPWISS